ncbi:unnamed protein product [Gordionus sp. m RMFG-2023]|uniref:pituitary tumor-transforming gene 1 protein-interacting protein-like n=1 Tax=Gordionus sp. m RMFG-2023 TaxID=3053472 RepID=UPI0030E45D55
MNQILTTSLLVIIAFVNISALDLNCNLHSGFCDQCVKASTRCYFCSSDRICRPYPYRQGFPTLAGECNLRDAHWATCSINLLIIVILIGIGLVLLLLSFLSCCCWCWIRNRRRRQRQWQRLEDKQKREKEEREAIHQEKQVERKAKWDGMRQKYGIANQEED